MPAESTIAQNGVMTFLNTVTQALPTNGATSLVSNGAVAIPTTPASALQVIAPQALAIMNPNQYQQGVRAPVAMYKRPVVIVPVVLGVLGIGALFYLMSNKKKR